MQPNFYPTFCRVLGFVALLFLLGSAKAQSLKITGTVVDDATQEPLPAVSITLKGKNRGTTTDANGAYVLTVDSKNDVIVFSYVGYVSQEVSVGNSSTLNVSLLEDADLLDEVVVVGYGTQSKASLTGSVSTIKADVIENRPITNLATGLQGTAPGLIVTRTNGQPGNESVSINIRGVATANGTISPLVIVDGVTAPSGTLTSLNPNDVESVTVLKDAAAAAIYGAQAAGGVILVTTKKGTSQKVQFDFSSLIGRSWLINSPDRMTLLQEAEFNNLAFTNAGASAQYSEFDLENIRNNVPYIVNPNDTTQYIYYNQIPHPDVLLNKYSPMQQYNLSARGGNENINFFMSGGYYNKQGAFKYGNDSDDRYNFRMNLNTKLNKYLSLDSRLAYTNQAVNQPAQNANDDYGLFYEVYRFRTRFPQLTPEGRYRNGTPTLAKLKEGGYNDEKRNYFDGVFTLKAANFIDGLSMRAVLGKQYRRSDEETFVRTVPMWGRFKVEGYLNPTNQYRLDNRITRNTNVQYLINYDKVFAEKHTIALLGGYQWEDYRYESQYSRATNLISNDLPLLNLGDDLTKSNGQNIDTYAYQSFFGRANYVFNKRYIAEATYRVDESSKLAPGLRTKGFASVSLGWNLHEENWFNQALPFFTQFKLRGSWGQLGGSLGSALGYYDYANLLSRGSGLVLGDTRTTYFYQSTIPSTNLSWETIETTDGGIDFGIFQNKLQFSGDYFVRYNRNMLTPQQLPATLGISTPRKNDGELKTWGWETELTYRDKVGKAFNYHISMNLSDNQNRLIKYSNNQVVRAGFNNLIEGLPLNTLWGYKTDGYFSSTDEVKSWAFQNSRTGAGDIKYIDQNGDNKINVGGGVISNTGDLVYLGTNDPRYLFGVNLGFEVKGFDFTAFVQGVGKRNYLTFARSVAPLLESWRMPLAVHLDYWTPENPNALYPRPYYQANHNYLPSDKWILNGAYARLKNLQVGYTLPKEITERVRINRARIFFSGQDLLTISKLGALGDLFDPESRNNVANDYPFFGTASLGLNLNF